MARRKRRNLEQLRSACLKARYKLDCARRQYTIAAQAFAELDCPYNLGEAIPLPWDPDRRGVVVGITHVEQDGILGPAAWQVTARGVNSKTQWTWVKGMYNEALPDGYER